MAPTIVSDATRAAALLFGRLLAEDVQPFIERLQVAADGGLAREEFFYVEVARKILHDLDRLDVGPDEGDDRDREALQHAHGAIWILLAENGRIPTHYIEHLLGHLGDERGVVGPPVVRHLLKAIAAADGDTLDSLALSCPEYVGLYRAYRDVPDAIDRLAAALDQRR